MRDLDNGRRYGTIEDFRNFVKLAYLRPHLHHSGGTVCEPVDVPVNKRHLDMVYSHIRYSDKPFMGSVTAPERARDTVEMARITFGADYLEDHPVILSPDQREQPARLGRDDARRGAGLRRGEPGDAAHAVHPGRRDGAGDRRRVCAQTLAEALGGMTFVQLVRPGAPGRPRQLRRARCRCSRARPTFGTPEPALVLYAMAALARRLGVPFRSGGNLCASKIADAQAAYESAATFGPTILAGVNFVLHAAGWLEGGLAIGYEKFILDADQCGMAAVFVKGIDMSENGQAARRDPRERPRPALPRHGPHPGQLRDRLLPLRDRRQQQLRAVAGGRVARRGPAGQRDLEADAPRVRGAALDEGIDEALQEFIAKRKASMPDSEV